MILIYTPVLSNRLVFIFRFLLEKVAGGEVDFTRDKEAFEAFDGPKFSYAPTAIAGEPVFIPAGLLTEKGISEKQIITIRTESTIGLFPVRKGGLLPFDPFSAAFFLLSRYEEYLPHKKDSHNRFEATESLLVQDDLVEVPLVDQWAYLIRNILSGIFPTLNFSKRQFSYISTIDVDSAFAYKEKGVVRTTGALARAITKFDLDDIKHRTRVIAGIEPDPYDSFDFQREIQEKYNFPVIYFVLVADYGLNNKNISHTSERFRRLIKSLSDHARIGIHPGYNSGYNLNVLKKEIERLEAIVNREIVISRQHFLRVSFPDTYRNLIEAGIQADYSMGYASRCGFRAGTCTPFPFYDLDTETATSLMVYPFTYMEGTLLDYMNLTPAQARQKVDELMAAVKAVDGTFISLWHNESIGGGGRWEGWQELYKYTAERASGLK